MDYPRPTFWCQHLLLPRNLFTNSKDLEKERNLALVDKIKQDNIDKIPKEKLTFLSLIMDAVWMTQNLQALTNLCFGLTTHSSVLAS
jgi:hypothetical protein